MDDMIKCLIMEIYSTKGITTLLYCAVRAVSQEERLLWQSKPVHRDVNMRQTTGNWDGKQLEHYEGITMQMWWPLQWRKRGRRKVSRQEKHYQFLKYVNHRPVSMRKGLMIRGERVISIIVSRACWREQNFKEIFNHAAPWKTALFYQRICPRRKEYLCEVYLREDDEGQIATLYLVP